MSHFREPGVRPGCARGARSAPVLRRRQLATPGPLEIPDAPGASRIPRRWGRSPGALRAHAGLMRRSSKYSRAHPALVVQRAIAICSALTPSEQKLWILLRGGQLGVWVSAADAARALRRGLRRAICEARRRGRRRLSRSASRRRCARRSGARSARLSRAAVRSGARARATRASRASA
jgi:hypothetical protein